MRRRGEEVVVRHKKVPSLISNSFGACSAVMSDGGKVCVGCSTDIEKGVMCIEVKGIRRFPGRRYRRAHIDNIYCSKCFKRIIRRTQRDIEYLKSLISDKL